MKKTVLVRGISIAVIGASLLAALSACSSSPATSVLTATSTSTARDLSQLVYSYDQKYTLLQAMSDKAQLSTIAFNGLAFLTGNANADTFFPPGKVADFFGFQYMRDVDAAGYGHNTTFLTKAAMSTLAILTDAQKQQLVTLAQEQTQTYADFAYNRLILINAFRKELEGTGPAPRDTLDRSRVADYASNLYGLDADLSIARADVVGGIIHSLTDEQKQKFSAYRFNDSSTWLDAPEDDALKQSLSNAEYQAVMTYASEMFSWYLGDVAADTYFCPERHGTYFGGFFMKDYPAMGNPDYFISTTVTGDKGQAFLDILTAEQRALITNIIDEQRADLTDMAQTRWTISELLRAAQQGSALDAAKITTLITHYGELDGRVSALYAEKFAAVKKTLTSAQMEQLTQLRDLAVVPENPYRFATPVISPDLGSNDYLFGVGSMPQNAGASSAPTAFVTATDPSKPAGQKQGKKK